MDRAENKLIPFIAAHWRSLLKLSGVLGLVLGGWLYGHRVGYRAGYSAGLANAPRCPVVQTEVKTDASEQKCTSKVETKYVYRAVPSGTKDCPSIVVPVPEVTYESDSTGKSGGAEASVVVRPVEQPPVSAGAVPSRFVSEPSRWHASGLVGVGSSGVEVGGSASYRVLGPIDIGVYGRVPLHDAGRASAGVSLGFQF